MKVACSNHAGPVKSSAAGFMDELGAALSSAVSRAVSGKARPGILFSGGLDSTVLAFLAKKAGAAPLLIAAGAESSEDIRFAKNIAAELEMRLETRILSPPEIQRLYAKAAEISGETELMKLELGLLLLACCEAAEKEGIRLLVSGAGAEELFLGYKMHSEKNAANEDLEELRRKELAGLQEKDLRRSEKIASSFGIRLALPYLDEAVVGAALKIPAAKNFRNNENKAVLRSLARSMGVPAAACSRAKRAMQYGSGVHAALQRLAKRN